MPSTIGTATRLSNSESSPAEVELSPLNTDDAAVLLVTNITVADEWNFVDLKDTAGNDETLKLCSGSEVKLNNDNDNAIDNQRHRKQIKIYPARWYILGVFSAYVTLQYFIWNMFGPIASSLKKVFRWENSDIATLVNWDTILYVFSAMQLCWLIQEKGLRKTFLISLMSVVVGAVFRSIAHTDDENPKLLMNIGQILNAFGGILSQAAGPFISSTWFPPSERTTATAIATLTSQLGLALSYIIGPLVVEDLPVDISDQSRISNNISQNISFLTNDIANRNIKAMEDEIAIFMLYELGFALALFIVSAIYFPNKPELPPSTSASIPKIDFKGGFYQLLYLKHFWLILIITSSVTGIYSGWGAVLYLNFKDNGLDISQTQCGWIGFTTTIFSVAGGVLLSYISDRFPGNIRMFLVMMFSIASAAFSYIAFMCQQMLQYSTTGLYIACIIGGFCINGSIPLMYEITIELTYPIPETVSVGLLGVVNNIFTFVFLLLLNIPGIEKPRKPKNRRAASESGTIVQPRRSSTAVESSTTGVKWMNWTLLTTCVISLLLLGMFREQYSRMEVDQSFPTTTISHNAVHLPQQHDETVAVL